MNDEEWRAVEGYDGYFISNRGRVKGKRVDIMKQMDHYKGYKYLFLSHEANQNKKHFLHRLVAVAFIPNPSNKPFVNHIDCNKTNNNVENLEWMSEQENTQYYWKMKGIEINPENMPF